MAKKRVLVVDDEVPVANGIRRILQEHYDVQVALPEDAQQILQTQDFDCVICDVNMPHTTGLELEAAIRVTRPELADRFIFHTASPHTERTNGTPVLEKPASIALIRSEVRKMAMKGVDLFKPLTPEELADLPPMTSEEIQEALDQGRRDMEEAMRNQPSYSFPNIWFK